MALRQHNIQPSVKRRKRKNLGRGNGSGHGTYSCKGIKGQSARSGVGGLKLKGMRHIVLSTPKLKGFRSIHAKPITLTLNQLGKNYQNGETVDINTLVTKSLIKNSKAEVKILASGEISKSLIIKGCQVSGGAKEKIEKAGGKIE
ncbi:MAG: 50S ribosomal protein L15 [Patescibacteria group bacterium]